MTKGFHIVAGLPRSGSTLLCNLLNMNPSFHASSTSSLLSLIKSQHKTFSHSDTAKAENRLELQPRLAKAQKAFIESYCDYGKVYFDKNRDWPSFISQLDYILNNTDTKIIWCYRHPLDIIASMENTHQKTILLEYTDDLVKNDAMNTLSKRVNTWIQDEGIISRSVNYLQDAIEQGYSDRIAIIRYSDIYTDPQLTLDTIHSFIGESYYNYSNKDFKDLIQTTEEADTLYNYKYPHKIKEGVINPPKPRSLPDTYTEEIVNQYKWIIDHCKEEPEINKVSNQLIQL